jgi:hypothetical protein
MNISVLPTTLNASHTQTRIDLALGAIEGGMDSIIREAKIQADHTLADLDHANEVCERLKKLLLDKLGTLSQQVIEETVGRGNWRMPTVLDHLCDAWDDDIHGPIQKRVDEIEDYLEGRTF